MPDIFPRNQSIQEPFTINVFGTDINLQQQSNILHLTITATKAHFTGPACHMMKEDYNSHQGHCFETTVPTSSIKKSEGAQS